MTCAQKWKLLHKHAMFTWQHFDVLPSGKESSLPTTIFQGRAVKLRGCRGWSQLKRFWLTLYLSIFQSGRTSRTGLHAIDMDVLLNQDNYKTRQTAMLLYKMISYPKTCVSETHGFSHGVLTRELRPKRNLLEIQKGWRKWGGVALANIWDNFEQQLMTRKQWKYSRFHPLSLRFCSPPSLDVFLLVKVYGFYHQKSSCLNQHLGEYVLPFCSTHLKQIQER